MSSRRHLPSPQLSQLAHVGKGFNRLSRRSPSHCRSVHRLKCNSPGRREFDLCPRPSPRVHSMQAVDFCSHPKRRKLPGRNSSYCLPDWDWWRPSNPCPRMASRCLAEVPNQSLLESSEGLTFRCGSRLCFRVHFRCGGPTPSVVGAAEYSSRLVARTPHWPAKACACWTRKSSLD